MMDLRHEKQFLREKFKSVRRSMTPLQKEEYDRLILERLASLYQYRCSSLILTYVSKDIEVDTINLIKRVLSDNKRAAVPRCRAETREMDFYEIESLDQLEEGYFGVLEPDPARCPRVTDFSDSFCIVPGLAFDSSGFRLGYGKGFYDRFLQEYDGPTAGLCYSSCVRWKLPVGKYDKTVDLVVTEKFFRKTSRTI